MGIMSFAKKMAKIDLKNNILYIMSIIFTSAFIMNSVNISYNNAIYEGAQVLQKQYLLILVLGMIIFAYFCNSYFIRRKAKEAAFCLINGASLIDLTKYLLYQNGVIYVLGGTLGLLLGVFCIPLCNILMYTITGIWGSLFTFSIEAFLLTTIIIFLEYIIIVILDFGIVYRKELVELLNLNKEKNLVDNRVFKVNGKVFVLLYLLPVLFMIFFRNTQGSEHAMYVLTFLGAVGIYGVIKYYAPQNALKINKKDFMFNGLRKIYVGNFISTLKTSTFYFIALAGMLIYFAYGGINYGEVVGVKESCLFSFVGASIIIGFSLLYKLSVEADERKILYKQLKILGYHKEEISEILSKEYILFFGFGLALPLLLVTSALIVFSKVSSFTVTYSLALFISAALPLILAGIYGTVSNKKKILNSIYGGNQ